MLYKNKKLQRDRTLIHDCIIDEDKQTGAVFFFGACFIAQEHLPQKIQKGLKMARVKAVNCSGVMAPKSMVVSDFNNDEFKHKNCI